MQKINDAISKIKPLDEEIMKEAKERQDFLTKPKESLGKLEDISIKIAGITGKIKPKVSSKIIFTLAGDHGAVEEGVSAYPQEVTPQMVYNFLRGGAGINVLAKHVGAKVIVADLGVKIDLEPHPELKIKKVGHGTKNFTKEPAMSREEAIRSIEVGIELVDKEIEKMKKNGIDLTDGFILIGTGDMGIGNTTPSSAITAAITGATVEDVTGRGTGLDDKQLENKINVIKKALEINNPDSKDPIDVLSKVGGFEIGGLAGVIIGGVSAGFPVVIDGFISSAGALIATEISPQIKDYIIASHCSVEAGHRVILNWIGVTPLLNLNMRLGEGTGSALAMNIVEASCKILSEMATFAEAGVSEKT